MAYSKVRWISTPAFLACVGGAHDRGEGTNVREGARTAEVGVRMAEGGRTRFSGGRVRLGGARKARGLHGSREWRCTRQGGGFGGFASSSFLVASSLHDWLTFRVFYPRNFLNLNTFFSK
jgi:hypothetical protein